MVKKTKAKPKKRKTSKKRKTKKNISYKKHLKSVAKWFCVAMVWLVIILSIFVAYCAYDLPKIELDTNNKNTTIILLDEDGVEFDRINKSKSTFAKFEDIPKHLIDAVISTEDRRFYRHNGLDILGVFRAFFENVKAGRVVQGGSTITQQLAKITFLNNERTIKRKIRELILSFYLERKFSKQQILELYLNKIYLGSGNYGVHDASKDYFNKNISNIQIYQSAILAGIIKAPSKYNPKSDLKLAQNQGKLVLSLMLNNEKIEQFQLDEAVDELENYYPASNTKSNIKYFSDYVIKSLSDYVDDYQGYLKVKTTLNRDLQSKAENILTQTLNKHGKAKNISQGAIVVMSKYGEILALVGGKSYQHSQYNRALYSKRQSGSAFKIFVYLAALQAGYTMEDLVVDEPIDVNGWQPENFNKKHKGIVSFKNSFAYSINSIAVKIAHEIGIKTITKLANKMGVTSLINRDLTSALGSSEISLLELTTAYAHIANEGRSVWHHVIKKINNSQKTLYSRDIAKLPKILDDSTLYQMQEMLRSVVDYGTGKKAKSYRFTVGKTGTSQNFRDALFVGYNTEFIAGIWLGNDDNSPMKSVTGGSLPALMFKKLGM